MSYQRGVRPDYTVGTITLVSNSKNFTTVGASLKTATIGSGDTIMTADGRVLIISEITGQNAGVLAYPCPASAAGANLPLRIRFQPSSSGMQGAVRDLLERWGLTGNIDTIAGLQGYAGAIIKFTGAGTAELIDVADIQMSDPHHNLAQLASLAKAANQFVIMGADASITLKPISELTDAIENNRLTILGHTASINDQSNTLSEHATVISGLQSAKFNNPSGAVSQFLRGDGTPQSVVGTATQAAGGAIVQRGSNANGEFIRFADGTQICWFAAAKVPQQDANVLRAVLTYPAAFSSQPAVMATVNSAYLYYTGSYNVTNLMASGGAMVVRRFLSNVSATIDIMKSSLGNWASGDELQVDALAIGRWF